MPEYGPLVSVIPKYNFRGTVRRSRPLLQHELALHTYLITPIKYLSSLKLQFVRERNIELITSLDNISMARDDNKRQYKNENT
jgi:hypothetical protein